MASPRRVSIASLRQRYPGPCDPRAVSIRRLLVMLILGGHAALLTFGATWQSPNLDEAGHLAAGLSHWQTGTYDLYRVNPPLVRMLATLPIAWLEPPIPWEIQRRIPRARDEFSFGAAFLESYGLSIMPCFTMARVACIPLSMIGALICYSWARERDGPVGGLIALLLWCTCPNILAHGQLITPDVGAASLGVLAGYAFRRWLERPGWPHAVTAGIASGLAGLAKTTLVVLLPVWLGIAAADAFSSRRTARRRRAGWYLQLGSVVIVALVVINAGYGGEGSLTRLKDYRFVSRNLAGERPQPAGWGNRFADSALGCLPVPLPRNYVSGIDEQRREFETPGVSRNYLRGEWRTRGWWYYYLYCLLVKVPIGSMVLVGCATLARLAADRGKRSGTDTALILLPVISILALVSSQTYINKYIRYVLPVLPYLYIWAGGAACLTRLGPGPGRGALRFVVGGALAWSAASSLSVYPHSMSYFNEFARGPSHGHEHLLGGNFDWNQDLLFLRRWADSHPEARPLRILDHLYPDPAFVGLPFEPPPRRGGARGPAPPGARAPEPGWYIARVMTLKLASTGHCYIRDGRGGRLRVGADDYSYLEELEPVATIGWTFRVYRVTAGQDR